ncbi:MAG: hypothetical protein E6K08_01140 [Methanobacteriota archaeon]|nr:MAG: hypothetical protein E6K08_01140 [Euryarchaeota archaeon]
MKASKFKTRVWNGIVIAASVLVLAFVLVAPGVTTPRSAGHVSALGASAYGGRSYAVGTYVPLLGGTTFADTGDLPPEGGVLVADFVSVGSDLANADGFLSYTRGFSDVGMSEVATSDVVLLPGSGLDVVASFAYVKSTATCSGVTAASEIPDLSVAGVVVDVTGEPNQVYEIPGVLTLVINEQIDSSSGAVYSITTNALHLYASGVEVVVGSAFSQVDCGGTGSGGLPGGLLGGLGTQVHAMWEVPNDFMTGGGFFFVQAGDGTCPGSRVNFGFNAGPRPGNPTLKGHLNLIDHGCGFHIEGLTVDDYFRSTNTDPDHCRDWNGAAKFNGAPGYHYFVTACDYGEPGRHDRFGITVVDQFNNGVYFADNRNGETMAQEGVLPGGNIQLHTF